MKLAGVGLLLSIGLVLSACSNDVSEESQEAKTEQNEEKTTEETTQEVDTKKEENVEKEETEEVKEIDTSVFEYAKNIEITNAIDINEHVTVFVEMSEETAPGLAAQHVINQTYDFIQQDDIEGAKTVSIAVKQGDIKTTQFTVTKDKFTPDDSKPMSEAVLKASEIEFMTDEVKTYGETMGTW
jgi:Sec-independent protein translocase protein TatA